MNYENIVARLKNGETMETIAQEMEDALNKANAEFQASQEKESKEAKLNELAETIATATTEYLRIMRPGMVKDHSIDGAELREAMDEMLPLLDLFGDIKVSVKTKTTPASNSKEKKSAEDVFADFFKSLDI